MAVGYIFLYSDNLSEYIPLDSGSRNPAWAEQIIEQGGLSGHGTWTVQIPVRRIYCGNKIFLTYN